MDRDYMFGYNSLRLPILPLVEYLQYERMPKQKPKSLLKQAGRPQVAPISGLCNGWQGYFDIQTQVITPYHDQKKLDEKDWARYFSGLIKGKHLLFPGALDIMWEKVKEGSKGLLGLEGHASKLLIECLKGHHAGDPYAAIAIALNVRFFLQGRLETKKIEAILQNLFRYWEPLLRSYGAEPPSFFQSLIELLSLNDICFTISCCFMNAGAYGHLNFPSGSDSSDSLIIRPISNDGRFAYSISIPNGKGSTNIILPFMGKESLDSILKLFDYESKSLEDIRSHLKLFKDLFIACRPVQQPRPNITTIYQSNRDNLRECSGIISEFQERSVDHPHLLLKNLGLSLMLSNQANEDQHCHGETIIKNAPVMLCFESDKEARQNLIQRFSDFLSFHPWNLSSEETAALFMPFQDQLEKSSIKLKSLSISWIKALATSGKPSLCKIAYALWLKASQKDDFGSKNLKELYKELLNAFLKGGHRSLAVNLFLTMHPKDNFKSPQEAWEEFQEICNRCSAAKAGPELAVDVCNLGRALQGFVDMKELPWKERAPLQDPQAFQWLIENLCEQGQDKLSQNFLHFLSKHSLVSHPGLLANSWIRLCESYLNNEKYGLIPCVSAWDEARPQGIWKNLEGNTKYEGLLEAIIDRLSKRVDASEAMQKFLQAINFKKLSPPLEEKAQRLLKLYRDQLLLIEDCSTLNRELTKGTGRTLPPAEKWPLHQKIIAHHVEKNDFAEAAKLIGSLAKNKDFYSDPMIASEIRKTIEQIYEKLSPLRHGFSIFKISCQLLLECNPRNIYKNDSINWFETMAVFLERAVSERDSLAYDILELVVQALQELQPACIPQKALSRFAVCLGTALFKPMGERPFSANLKALLLNGQGKLFEHCEYHKLGIETCTLILGFNNHKIEMPDFVKDASIIFRAADQALNHGMLDKESGNTVYGILKFVVQKQWRLPKASQSLQVKVYTAFFEDSISKMNLERASFCLKQLQSFHLDEHPSIQRKRLNGLYAQLLRKMGKVFEELQFVRQNIPENLLAYIEDIDTFRALFKGIKDSHLISLAYQELFLGAMALEQIHKNPSSTLELYLIRMDLEKHLDPPALLQFHYAVDFQLIQLLVSIDNGLEGASKVLDVVLESIRAFVVDFVDLNKNDASRKESKEKYSVSIQDCMQAIIPIVPALEPANRSLLVKQVITILNYEELLWETPANILRLMPFLNAFSDELLADKAGSLLLSLLNDFPEKLTQKEASRVSALKNETFKALENLIAYESCCSTAKLLVVHPKIFKILDKPHFFVFCEKLLSALFGDIKKTKDLIKTIVALNIIKKHRALISEYAQEPQLKMIMESAAHAVADLALVHRRLDLFTEFGTEACLVDLHNSTKKITHEVSLRPALHLVTMNLVLVRSLTWRSHPQYKEQDNEIFKHVIGFLRSKFFDSIADTAYPDSRCMDILSDFVYALTLIDKMDDKFKEEIVFFCEFLVAFIILDRIERSSAKGFAKSKYKIWTSLILKERNAFNEILMVALGLKKNLLKMATPIPLKKDLIKLSIQEKNYLFNTIFQRLMLPLTMVRLNILKEILVDFQDDIFKDDYHVLVNLYCKLLASLSSFLKKAREHSEWKDACLVALQLIEFSKIQVHTIVENKNDFESCKRLSMHILDILLDKSIASQIPYDLNQDISYSTIHLNAENLTLYKSLSWRKSLIHAFNLFAPIIRLEQVAFCDYLNRLLDILFLKIETFDPKKALEAIKDNWDLSMAIFVDIVRNCRSPDYNHKVSNIINKKFIEKMNTLQLEGMSEAQFSTFEKARMAIFAQIYQLIALKPEQYVLYAFPQEH